jgi:hypothetical protein
VHNITVLASLINDNTGYLEVAESETEKCTAFEVQIQHQYFPVGPIYVISQTVLSSSNQPIALTRFKFELITALRPPTLPTRISLILWLECCISREPLVAKLAFNKRVRMLLIKPSMPTHSNISAQYRILSPLAFTRPICSSDDLGQSMHRKTVSYFEPSHALNQCATSTRTSRVPTKYKPQKRSLPVNPVWPKVLRPKKRPPDV